MSSLCLTHTVSSRKAVISYMDNLIILTQCEDKSCCCLSLRSTAFLISIVSLIGCLLDVLLKDSNSGKYCDIREHVNSLNILLLSLFQMANMLLLIGSIVENALLLQIYIWHTLGFILIGFLVTILDFCFRTKDEWMWSFATFVPEVIFLFVLFRCLSQVDLYKKHLEKI